MSNLPWFKLYADARVDKKLGILTLAERGVWINLLCYASEQSERGTFDATDRHMLALECAERDVELLNSTIEKLLQIRHLVPFVSEVTSDVTSVTSGNDDVTPDVTSNVLQFRTFHARQTQKVSNFPSDAPERVRERVAKYRASRKQTTQDSKPVTSVTSGNGTDRDIDRDKNTSNSSVISRRENNISVLAPHVTPLSRPASGAHAPRRKDPLWDVLVETFYEPQSKPERSNFGKIVRDLKEMGVTVEDVRSRVAQHAATCDWDLTPNALMTHWTELGRPPNPSRPRVAQNGHAVGDIPRTIAFED